MFSSTTMASSMTIPVARDSASSVMLFNVMPIIFMMMNVPINDTGMAMAAISVRAEISQEEEHNDAGQNTAENQVVLDIFDRLADEHRLVAADRDFDVAGSSVGLIFVQPLHHFVNDRDGVRASLLDDRK